MDSKATFGAGTKIHKTAIIEETVFIGSKTTVWDSAHIRHDTTIGSECIIGEKTYIAYDVRIGNRVKVNSFVYICTGVEIEDGVMVSAGVVFTNDKYPRSTSPDLMALRDSGPDETTLKTIVHEGATLGARCVVGGGIEVGRFAMVGMGAVVTRSVPDFGLVYGNPATLAGYVCRCGRPVVQTDGATGGKSRPVGCRSCGRKYALSQGRLTETLKP